MRRWMALVLLACLGWMIPAGSAPLRLCLLDGCLTVPTVVFRDQNPSKCCGDCHQGEPGKPPCCIEVGDLPDSLPPDSSSLAAPILASAHFPETSLVPRVPVCLTENPCPRAEVRTGGPPPDPQVVFGVWLI